MYITVLTNIVTPQGRARVTVLALSPFVTLSGTDINKVYMYHSKTLHFREKKTPDSSSRCLDRC